MEQEGGERVTFWKMLLWEHPDMSGARPEDKEVKCQSNWGYEKHFNCKGISCEKCWQRKMPGS